MSAFDRCSRFEGHVQSYLLNSVTGEETLLGEKHNTVLNDGNLVLARLMSGSRSAPSHIGFVVTASSTANLSKNISKTASLDDLVAGGSLIVAPLLAIPPISPVIDAGGVATGAYQEIFTSHTGAGTYFGTAPGSDKIYLRRAILLAPDSDGYMPFSAVDLSGTSISTNGTFHFGLHWTVAFGVSEG